jgi:hypothetical protein
MRPYTGEEWLLRDHLKGNVGIFACDDTIVISSMLVNLGQDAYGNNVTTWVNPPTSNAMGNLAQPGVTTNSWLNTLTFMVAFETILNDADGRIWRTDFFAKVDPDAVFFPDRLRNHVKAHVGQPVFYINCVPDKLYGALEVYSKEAMGLYKNNLWRCKNGMGWQGWGEDTYFSSCMRMLGVQPIYDFTLVGDNRCMAAPCSDPWRAAFHPFKDKSSWWGCWHASTHT